MGRRIKIDIDKLIEEIEKEKYEEVKTRAIDFNAGLEEAIKVIKKQIEKEQHD